MNKNPIDTIVCFHDLLGFGNMIAVSGGTLDSAVGEVSYNRVKTLRKTVSDSLPEFPSETKLFQMNDSAIAVCDIPSGYNETYTDPAKGKIPTKDQETCDKILEFLCASAKLHCNVLDVEERQKIGPGGRTFIVLGKRWPLDESAETNITDVPELQANLAFAEAYIADSYGEKAGFKARPKDRIFVNNPMWSLLKSIQYVSSDSEAIVKLNKMYGESDNNGKDIMFPDYLLVDERQIDVQIFHRAKKFRSILGERTKKIIETIRG
jgi:hypothetical protein